ncbi:MAG: type II toxin-antitoxin system RelE/ParE family toxin [Rhodoferax sp.]|nr:type II toxin-antitoxin system RelE/ParE family toxin [Rhodoferax sp.]
MLRTVATPSFTRIAKKPQAKDKKVLDAAVRAVAADVGVGTEKRGDLAGVFVYKFKMNAQETLLAIACNPSRKSPPNWCCWPWGHTKISTRR